VNNPLGDSGVNIICSANVLNRNVTFPHLPSLAIPSVYGLNNRAGSARAFDQLMAKLLLLLSVIDVIDVLVILIL
jgi:hypothetical protein